MATNVTVFDLHTGNQIYTADGKSDGGLSYISLLLNAAKTSLKDMEKKGLIHKLPVPRENSSDDIL